MIAPREVTIPARGDAPATPAFAMIPAAPRAGVVVIHEIMGRQPEIDRVVARLANAGYAAVAPDLFARGRFACLRDVFAGMRRGGDRGVAAAQGRAARAWLAEASGVPETRIGLTGFCFGGGYALMAGAGWAAVSTNYGFVPSAEVMRGMGPVIGCYGARDRVMAKSPTRLRERLAAIGAPAPEIHTYDVGHSFLTDRDHPTWQRGLPPFAVDDHPDEREDAWTQILAFFERHLAG